MDPALDEAVRLTLRRAVLYSVGAIVIAATVVPVAVYLYGLSAQQSLDVGSDAWLTTVAFSVVGTLTCVLGLAAPRVVGKWPVRRDSALVSANCELRQALEAQVAGAERLAALYVAAAVTAGVATMAVPLGFLVVVFGGPMWVGVALILASALVWAVVFPRRSRWTAAIVAA